MNMWLDNVWCDGDEEKLIDCPSVKRGPFVPSQCNRNEFAGVVCKARNKRVQVSRRPVTMYEGDTVTYGVWLEAEPSGTVTVAIGGTSGTDLSVSPTSLTFTTSNWNTRQEVSLTAASDADLTDDASQALRSACLKIGVGYRFPQTRDLGLHRKRDPLPCDGSRSSPRQQLLARVVKPRTVLQDNE